MTPTVVLGMILCVSGLYLVLPASAIDRGDMQATKGLLYGLGTLLGIMGLIVVAIGW